MNVTSNPACFYRLEFYLFWLTPLGCNSAPQTLLKSVLPLKKFCWKKLVNCVYKIHEKLRVLSTITKKNDWQTNTHPFHYTSVHLERCCGHFREMREIVTNCPRGRLQSTPPTRDARTGIEKRDGAQLPNCGEVIISRCVAHKQCGDKRELLTVPRAQPTSSQNWKKTLNVEMDGGSE